MMHFTKLTVGSKCNICDHKLKVGNSVIKKQESNKIICMLCLVELAARTNEPIKESIMAKDPSLENIKCPLCNGPMTSRKNKTNGSRFWGCNNFPVCKGTRDSMGESKLDKRNNEDEDDYNSSEQD